MKAAGHLAGSLGELVVNGTIGDGDAVIDEGRGGPRLLTGLEAHILQERGFGQVPFSDVCGVMNTLPPAHEVQQVVGVSAQRGVRQATNIFAIQVTIDPGDLALSGVLDDTKWTLCVMGSLPMDHAELHGWAASRRAWNCPASPPWTKKEFGSWPSGRSTRQVAMPCARRR